MRNAFVAGMALLSGIAARADGASSSSSSAATRGSDSGANTCSSEDESKFDTFYSYYYDKTSNQPRSGFTWDDVTSKAGSLPTCYSNKYGGTGSSIAYNLGARADSAKKAAAAEKAAAAKAGAEASAGTDGDADGDTPEPPAEKVENENWRDNINPTRDGDCAVSEQIHTGKKASCRGTTNVIEGAKVANQLGQVAGSTATAVVGQSNMAKIDGTQSSMMTAGADTQILGGKIQIGAGAANALAGALQLQRAGAHTKQAKEIRGGVTDQMIEGEFKTTRDSTTARQIRARGESEQRAKADESLAGAMQSLMTGAQQMVSGYFNIKAGNELKKAAGELKNIEGGQLPGMDPDMTAQDDMSNARETSVNPIGTSEAVTAAATDEDDGLSGGGELGKPFNTGDPKDAFAGPVPTPGAFAPGSGGSGSGGGGGGGLGGGSTAAATQDKEPTAQAPKQDVGGTGYGSSGTMMPGAGGGGKPDMGPDLSGLLAQFLPKKEEEKNKDKTIMDFGGDEGGGRAPASLLGRDVNIFKRIHDAYQEKQRARGI